jgi:glucose/arabinose dehydrogenase
MRYSLALLFFCLLSPAFAAYNTLVPAPGFNVELYADNIENARVPRLDKQGRLLLSSPGAGAIYIIEPDSENPGKAKSTNILIDKLDRPHGLDFYQDYLYIAEVTQIIRMKYDHETGAIGEPEVVVSGIPNQVSHARRGLRFHDDWMYLSIGSTCNSCIEKNPRYATIERFRPDGSDYQVVATGIRNAVDFNWAPDGKMYAVVNARDLLGDHFPPDTLIEVKQGAFYGWPYANGNLVPDPLLGNSKTAKELIATATPPVYEIQPHTAPLGISFLQGGQLPDDYQNVAIVGLHGSWNSTKKVGYKVITLHWDDEGNITERDFLTGFMRPADQKVFGRPVAAEQGPDGAIYITDDYADKVYRVTATE